MLSAIFFVSNAHQAIGSLFELLIYRINNIVRGRAPFLGVDAHSSPVSTLRKNFFFMCGKGAIYLPSLAFKCWEIIKDLNILFATTKRQQETKTRIEKYLAHNISPNATVRIRAAMILNKINNKTQNRSYDDQRNDEMRSEKQRLVVLYMRSQ